MTNRIFSDPALKLVLAPARWRIVSSLCAPDARPMPDKAHLAWMSTHVDRHPAREILLALRGEGLQGFQGKAYPCRPGSVFLFDAYEAHDNHYPPFAPAMLHLWLHILEGDVVARLMHVEGRRIRILGDQLVFSGDETMALLRRTWSDLGKAPTWPEPFRRAKLRAVLSAVLLRVVERGFEENAERPAESFQSKVIRSIQGHLAETAGRDVPLAEAARLAGYSKFHFLRLFQHETGQTFHEYVNLCRLQRLQEMLRDRQTKTSIAAALGFSHPSALLRWMKAMKIHA